MYLGHCYQISYKSTVPN